MASQRKLVSVTVLAVGTVCVVLLVLQQPEALWPSPGRTLKVERRVERVVRTRDGIRRTTRKTTTLPTPLEEMFGVNETRAAAPPSPPSPQSSPPSSPPSPQSSPPSPQSPPQSSAPSPPTSSSPPKRLPSTVTVFKGQPTPGEDHIFFLETSCALSDSPTPVPYDSPSGLRLSPRAACSLESVAAAHPHRPVYLLHTCAVREEDLKEGGAPLYALAALSKPNVRLWPVRYASLFVDSPLEAWLEDGAVRSSPWPVVHASDILRFVTIWKYGGTYFDQDVLMLRSLGNERNFGCAESTEEVSVGAFNFAWDDPGRRVANACLDALQDYRPDLWSYNGPGAITRALKNVCGVQEVSQMTQEHCRGFHLLPTSAFYAVPWQDWQQYFSESNPEHAMSMINNSLAAHVWNALSHDTVVIMSSQQPYAQIARWVCPKVVATVGDTM